MEGDHLEDPGVDGRLILKWISEKWDGRHGLDRSGSGHGQVAGSCECGDGRVFRINNENRPFGLSNINK
jgi:hypothetical protein